MRVLPATLLILSGLMASVSSFAQTFWPVNSTMDTDDGVCNLAHCTLREALHLSELNAGPDSIVFRFTGPGPHVINITSPLPAITQPTIINATTSSRVVLDGTGLTDPTEHGLVVYSSNVKIYGISLQDFPGNGIQVFGGFGGAPEHLSNILLSDNILINNGGHGIEIDMGDNVRILRNVLGSVVPPLAGNAANGLHIPKVTGAGSFIHGNSIASNSGDGIFMQVDPTTWSGELKITGNTIGTDMTGTLDLGHERGINIVGAGDVTVGGPGDSINVIAYNNVGVFSTNGTGKTLHDNRFICNSDPVQPNAPPTIPNNICVGNGVINGEADPNVRIDIFTVDTANCPNVPCQGNVLVATTQSDAIGFWSAMVNLPAGTAVAVMATDASGTSSAFSDCSDFVDVVARNTGPYCDEAVNNVQLIAEVSGNSSNASYRWFGPNFWTSNEQNPSGALFQGEYKLVVDFGECVFDTQYTEVIFSTTRNVFLTEFCEGDTWVVNGNTYGTGGALEGVETISGGTQFGCDSVMFFNLEQLPNIEAGFETPEFACIGDSVEIRLQALPASFGPFDIIYTDGVNPPDTIEDIFHNDPVTVIAQPRMAFEVLDIVTQLTPCDPILAPPDSLNVSALEIEAQLSDYNGFNVSCKSAEDGSIVLTASGEVGDVSYAWSPNFLSGDMVMDLGAGIYSVTVTDETGCNTVLDTFLTEPDGPEPVIDIFEPSCLGASDGAVVIRDVGNVQGTLTWSLDSVIFDEVTAFPIVIDTLPAGLRTLYFDDDIDNCVLVERLIVPNGDRPTIDVGGTRSITAGDSVQLGFTTDIEDPFISWSPPEVFDCPDCPDPFAKPLNTGFVSVFLVNIEGCSARDSVLIQVFIPKRVYIPNVFSPNGDGINDFFTISSNPYAVSIESMIVLNRGGVTVFGGENLPLDDNVTAWDGTMNGEPLNPGAYTYLVKVRFTDDQVIPFSGTVTLVR